MKKIVFIIAASPEGGYYAKAKDHSIVSQGESLSELVSRMEEAVRCHFDEPPEVISVCLDQ